jgi:hypothetical protein
MRHGQHHRLDQFLNLFITSSNITVFLGRFLIDFHGLDTRIEFGGKLFENEVGILVGPDEIGRFEILSIDEAWYGEENGLARRGSDDGRAGFAVGVGVEYGSFVGIFFFYAWSILSVSVSGGKYRE